VAVGAFVIEGHHDDTSRCACRCVVSVSRRHFERLPLLGQRRPRVIPNSSRILSRRGSRKR
jgi:hypothetical protein